MKFIFKDDKYLIRLFKGEDLFEELENFASTEKLKSGMLKGIGALTDVELGFYHLSEKTYERKNFDEEYELLSLDGNLSTFENKPFFHIHTVLGQSDFSCVGGHLFKAKVAVTTELYFFPLDETIHREWDKEIGLNLLNICPLEK